MWGADVIRKALIVVLSMATVAVVATWVLRNVADRVPAYSKAPSYSETSYTVMLLRGGFFVTYFKPVPLTFIWQNTHRAHVKFGGFLLASGRYTERHGDFVAVGYKRSIECPYWFAFLLLAFYPTITFIRGPMCRRRRRKQGHCLTCGYNLTGLTEPRCPECGTGFTLQGKE